MDSVLHKTKHLNVVALIIVPIILFIILCCCPLCCCFWAALHFLSIREKTLRERRTNFAGQWREQNPIIPFDSSKEWISADKGWEAWHFEFHRLPNEFNGLSTETFQSPEPFIALNSCDLQEINFNPLIGSKRKPQSVQCILPLMHGNESMGFRVACNYFEVSIVAYRPNAKKKTKSAGIVDGNLAIGLACRPAPPFRFPGLDDVSIGFHSKKGEIFIAGEGEVCFFGNPWNRIGATVGCGYDIKRGLCYFTQNNSPPVFTTFGVANCIENNMFPTIGADCDVTVVVNMGQNSFQCMPVMIANQVSFYNPGNAKTCKRDSTETCTKDSIPAITVVVDANDPLNTIKPEDESCSLSIVDKHVHTYSSRNIEREVQTTFIDEETLQSHIYPLIEDRRFSEEQKCTMVSPFDEPVNGCQIPDIVSSCNMVIHDKYVFPSAECNVGN